MAVLTNFLKLLKPEKNDYVDVDKHISENYDKIDGKMQELNTSNSGKLDKGALPTTIKSGKDLYDMLENNGGINIDTALLYLNDAGTKTQGKVYFDRNKKGLFECIKTTTNTVNSTEFFVDISNKASSDRLTNLIECKDLKLSQGNNTITLYKINKVVFGIASIFGNVDVKNFIPTEFCPRGGSRTFVSDYRNNIATITIDNEGSVLAEGSLTVSNYAGSFCYITN